MAGGGGGGILTAHAQVAIIGYVNLCAGELMRLQLVCMILCSSHSTHTLSASAYEITSLRTLRNVIV